MREESRVSRTTLPRIGSSRWTENERMLIDRNCRTKEAFFFGVRGEDGFQVNEGPPLSMHSVSKPIISARKEATLLSPSKLPFQIPSAMHGNESLSTGDGPFLEPQTLSLSLRPASPGGDLTRYDFLLSRLACTWIRVFMRCMLLLTTLLTLREEGRRV